MPPPVPLSSPAPSVSDSLSAAGVGLGYTVFTNSDGTIVRWNPCAPIHYAINAAAAPDPASAIADVRVAVGKVAATTGLRFVYDGTTGIVPTKSWLDADAGAAPPASGPSAASSVAGSTLSSADSSRLAATGGSTDRSVGSAPAASAAGASASASGSARGPALVIAWAPPGAGAGHSDLYGGDADGEGGWWESGTSSDGVTWTWQIERAFVVIDPARAAAYAPGFGDGESRGTLLMHELGHAVGLGHTNDRREVMFPVVSASSRPVWGAGDLAGLAKVGANAGCIS